jgi:hypothetical protein
VSELRLAATLLAEEPAKDSRCEPATEVLRAAASEPPAPSWAARARLSVPATEAERLPATDARSLAARDADCLEEPEKEDAELELAVALALVSEKELPADLALVSDVELLS